MSKTDAVNALRNDMRQIGFPEQFLKLVTAHGMRTGGALDLPDGGTDMDAIIIQGRWHSDAFKAYLHSSPEISSSVLKISLKTQMVLPIPSLKLGSATSEDTMNIILNSIHKERSLSSSVASIISASQAPQEQVEDTSTDLSSFKLVTTRVHSSHSTVSASSLLSDELVDVPLSSLLGPVIKLTNTSEPTQGLPSKLKRSLSPTVGLITSGQPTVTSTVTRYSSYDAQGTSNKSSTRGLKPLLLFGLEAGTN